MISEIQEDKPIQKPSNQPEIIIEKQNTTISDSKHSSSHETKSDQDDPVVVNNLTDIEISPKLIEPIIENKPVFESDIKSNEDEIDEDDIMPPLIDQDETIEDDLKDQQIPPNINNTVLGLFLLLFLRHSLLTASA